MTRPDPQPLRQEAERLLDSALNRSGGPRWDREAVLAEIEAAFLRQRQEAFRETLATWEQGVSLRDFADWLRARATDAGEPR